MPKREIADFIAYWSAASASERSNSQRFLLELCDLLAVPHPDHHPNAVYFFEHPVTEHHLDGTTSQVRIDHYKRACFVLESKQFQEAIAEASQLELAAQEAGVIAKEKTSQPVRGTDAWDDAMIKARGQAERYVRALPADEPTPPFLVVVDVGHTFELFADFSQAGKAYLPFPNPRTFRIRLKDLADEKIRARPRLIWTDPAALDPARQSADVTREVSAHLAELAKSLEQAGHEPEVVAHFERWATNPQVRDWICQAWVSPEERERRLRAIFGLPPEPPEEAAPTTPESNPVKPSQTESDPIQPNQIGCTSGFRGEAARPFLDSDRLDQPV